MWFYEQVVSNSVGKQQPRSDEDNMNQADTFGSTSGDEDSACSVPPSPPVQLEEDEGVEIDEILKAQESQVERQSSETASKYSKSSYTRDISVMNAISSMNSPSPEQEQGSIEVEAAGRNFSRKNLDGMDEKISLLSCSSSSSKGEKDRKPRACGVFCTRKRMMCFAVLAMVALLLLIAGLTYGAIVTSKANQKSSVSALIDAEEEDPTGVDIVNVDQSEEDEAASPSQGQGDDPIIETTFSPDTAAPSPSATEAGTTASTVAATVSATTANTIEATSDGTFIPTEISCSSDHSILVGATCQNDGFESWSAIQILYCFSRTRDGDWYWIRGVDNDYDRWDYTEGSAEGTLDFTEIPAGNYLVSLVRDSMRPYDILVTEELVVPNCDTTAS